MTETTEIRELTQVWLGMEPYVLIRFKLGDEGDDDLRAVIEAGGGPDSREDIGAALALALTSLPPSANPLVDFLDEIAAENPINDGLEDSERAYREGVRHALSRIREELGGTG